MAIRSSLSIVLVVSGMIGLMAARIRAADEPAAAAAQTPVYSGLVPDDAFVAVVLHPRRVLTSAAVAKFDAIKSMADDLAKETGVSPLDCEQLVVLEGPPLAGSPQPRIALICRLSKAPDAAEMASKLLHVEKPEESEVAGHQCFHRKHEAFHGTARDLPGVCFVDRQTFVTASESWLPKIFAAKDAKSPLISALAANESADDATIIFTNTDAAKETIAAEISAKAFPGPLRSIGDLPGLLQAAKLTARTHPEISLKLTLNAKDETSAEKIDQTIKSLQQVGQAFLPALQAPPDEKLPAEQRESRAYAAMLATKLINDLTPHQSGKQVTLEFKDLGTADAMLGKLILPAITSARAAAKRVQGMNNLKQLGLAMNIAQVMDNHFPPHAIYSKDGKPLLSWRVYLLQHLDQEALFKQFHLDEPWDSANNKPLIARMPEVFKSPTGKPLAAGQTRYVVAVGKDTIFDGRHGIGPEKITDGTSNTILILEVGDDKAVTWTKPDDMEFDPQKPLAGLGTTDADRIPATFADGSVHMLGKNIDAETFRRLILRNDGQPINPSKYQAR